VTKQGNTPFESGPFKFTTHFNNNEMHTSVSSTTWVAWGEFTCCWKQCIGDPHSSLGFFFSILCVNRSGDHP
jgi:hypothetical protein